MEATEQQSPGSFNSFSERHPNLSQEELQRDYDVALTAYRSAVLGIETAQHVEVLFVEEGERK
jgi:hypothetical protein